MASRLFYDLSATDLCEQEIYFDKYRRKVVLIVNVASLWGSTTREYKILNEIQCDYGKGNLAILAFPCNQFLHQESLKNEEILDFLRFVRPGENFEPTFDIFQKVDVNGLNTHPVFQFLRGHLPFSIDNPMPLMATNAHIIWSPVERSDISGNFEKFLLSSDGVPFKRFSSRYNTCDIREDIEDLISKIC